jgi:bacterioferritin (cytochrome b1)
MMLERMQAQSNIQQTQATVEGEVQKDVVEHQLNMQSENTKADNALNQIVASAQASIQQTIVAESVKPEPKPKGDA